MATTRSVDEGGAEASVRPYHHGALREALLVEAERMLRERGAAELSLRDLARQIGVSHAAPRRHFADRQALLDALAARGFTRLRDNIRAATRSAGEDDAARVGAAATEYVRFAVDDAALFDLMFAVKSAAPSDDVRAASDSLFAVMRDVLDKGRQASMRPSGAVEHLYLLFAATLQGIATFVSSGRIDRGLADALIGDAVAYFMRNGRA